MRQIWTTARRPCPMDKRPYSSYKPATFAWERQLYQLQRQLLKILEYTNCTKIFKKFFIFLSILRIDFFEIYDIIFIEKIKKGYGDVYG